MEDSEKSDQTMVASQLHPAADNLKDLVDISAGASVKESFQQRSQFLIESANNTFKELCRTLDEEQSKLTNLEERRRKLEAEMIQLKADIEKEKHNCREALEAANSDVDIENMASTTTLGTQSEESKKDSESDQDVEESESEISLMEKKSPAEISLSIMKGLQNVVNRHNESEL